MLFNVKVSRNYETYWDRKRIKQNNFVLFEQSKFKMNQSHLIF